MDHYEGEQSNVVSVTRGCVGLWLSNLHEKKCYVTLEWPQCTISN